MTVFTRLAFWHRVSVVFLRSWWYVHHSRDSGPSQSSSTKWCFHCSWKLSFKPGSPFVLTNLTAPKTLSINSFSLAESPSATCHQSDTYHYTDSPVGLCIYIVINRASQFLINLVKLGNKFILILKGTFGQSCINWFKPCWSYNPSMAKSPVHIELYFWSLGVRSQKETRLTRMNLLKEV